MKLLKKVFYQKFIVLNLYFIKFHFNWNLIGKYKFIDIWLFHKNGNDYVRYHKDWIYLPYKIKKITKTSSEQINSNIARRQRAIEAFNNPNLGYPIESILSSYRKK